MTAIVGSTASLKAAAGGSLIKEDIMAKIWDASLKETPFLDMITYDTCSNRYAEWTEDALASANLNNAIIEGADAATDDTKIGTRQGNHVQNSRKVVKIADTVESQEVFGRGSESSYQLAQRSFELARDIEAIVLGNQGSVADNADTIPGRAGGLGSWIKNQQYGLANSAGAAGFNTTTKVTANVAVSNAATTNAVSQTGWQTAINEAYANNGNITVLMTVPQVIAKINQFLVANTSAQKAILQSSVSGTSPQEMVAQGYVSVIMTNFGTALKLVPNRMQQTYLPAEGSGAARADVFMVDTGKVVYSTLTPTRTYEIAKLGSSRRFIVDTDWTLKVPNIDCHAVIRNVNVAASVAL